VSEISHSPGEVVEPYCLSVTDIETITTDREIKDGDLPLHVLLTDIIMKIFMNESFPRICVEASSCQAYVFYAAGFYGDFNDTFFIRTFQEARAVKKIFPPFKQLPNITFWLEKSDFGFATSIVSRCRDKISPALVDFTLSNDKITWEKRLAERMPLGDVTGPILPEFHAKDLSKYQ
jgi:hypothetical protein